jgi:prefoldin subunit 5
MSTDQFDARTPIQLDKTAKQLQADIDRLRSMWHRLRTTRDTLERARILVQESVDLLKDKYSRGD